MKKGTLQAPFYLFSKTQFLNLFLNLVKTLAVNAGNVTYRQESILVYLPYQSVKDTKVILPHNHHYDLGILEQFH